MPSPDLTSEPAANALLAALDGDRLRLALQPVVERGSRKTAFYEALLRLQLPDGSCAAATDFIAEAERLGLVGRFDRRAQDLALALLSKHSRLKLSLNVSSLTTGDSEWIAALKTRLASAPDIAGRLTIEITETAIIDDLDRVAAFVDLLHKAGCKVAIDDFGAGYTSFRHLRTLQVDMLKIDGMFAKDLSSSSRDRALVKAMIEMGAALGLETVAEEVADEEAAAFLETAGASYQQGFLYGAPLPAADAARQGLI